MTKHLYLSMICLFISSQLAMAQATDAWYQKADFAGTGREVPVSFSVNGKGYIGMGDDGSNPLADVWEYNPASNSWIQKASFPDTPRFEAFVFTIGSKAYIGGGFNPVLNKNYKDLWEFDPAANTWTRKADFGGLPVRTATGFAINGMGYVCTGSDSTGWSTDLWQYNPGTNSWAKKADFPGTGRIGGTAFSIGSIAYFGTGFDSLSVENNDFWAYNSGTNSWAQKMAFPGNGRRNAAAFAIGNTGYLGVGNQWVPNLFYYNDFYSYNTGSDMWTRVTDYTGWGRGGAGFFSIGNYGYVGAGIFNGTIENDFWQYSPNGSTGVNDLSAADFTMYPSPANDFIFIKSTGIQPQQVTIYDVSGKRILDTAFSERIDIVSLASGMYYVEVKSETGVVRKVLVKI